MARVSREAFVPTELREEAAFDEALPIGFGQTISQPYVVALMTSVATIDHGARVLEIGTGSGFQAAVLCALGAEVYSIEIVPELHARAKQALDTLGYRVHLRQGDGSLGWPEASPFESILVTAAPRVVPPALFEQLAIGGRLVAPVGSDAQVLQLWTREPSGLRVKTLLPVRFVPLTGAGA